MDWNNFHTITPLEIYFQGITDEEGKLYCQFNEKQAVWDEKYEIGLLNFYVDCDTVKNVKEKTELITFIDKSGGKK